MKAASSIEYRGEPISGTKRVVALGSGAVVARGAGVHSEIAPGSAWTAANCSGANAGSALCTQLASDVDSNRLNRSISAACYVCAGALAAASIATWILWKPELAIRPTIGARGAGFVLGWQW
jgi:hypothetical protein